MMNTYSRELILATAVKAAGQLNSRGLRFVISFALSSRSYRPFIIPSLAMTFSSSMRFSPPKHRVLFFPMQKHYKPWQRSVKEVLPNLL